MWTILVALLILWFLGLINDFGGNLIHLLVVVGVTVFIFNVVIARRSA